MECNSVMNFFPIAFIFVFVLLVLWLVNLFAWAKLPSPLPWFDKDEPVVEEVVETVETVVVEDVVAE